MKKPLSVNILSLSKTNIIIKMFVEPVVESKILLKLKMPKGVLIDELTIPTTVDSVKNPLNNSVPYIVKLKIDELTKHCKNIYYAYLEYRQRENVLIKTKQDFNVLKESLTKLHSELTGLSKSIQAMTTSMSGVVEIVNRNISGGYIH